MPMRPRWVRCGKVQRLDATRLSASRLGLVSAVESYSTVSCGVEWMAQPRRSATCVSILLEVLRVPVAVTGVLKYLLRRLRLLGWHAKRARDTRIQRCRETRTGRRR